MFESRDLVHWRQIGNVIDRPRELSFDGKDVSRGIFAPTIRYHNGLFYLITTAVDSGGNAVSSCQESGGAVVDAGSAAGDQGGIDSSPLFDDNGKAYVVNNGLPRAGHRSTKGTSGDLDPGIRSRRAASSSVRARCSSTAVWTISKNPMLDRGAAPVSSRWMVILMCAEGGTSTQHSEVVLRSRSPWGPFKPSTGNPILTQRDLPADRAGSGDQRGHADLIAAADGRGGPCFSLRGRTRVGITTQAVRRSCCPVTWHDGWPVILPKGKQIPYVVQAPKFPSGEAIVGRGPKHSHDHRRQCWRGDDRQPH